MNDNNKLLASLAVFRELYDKDDNINQILSEFIIEIIKKHKLHQFLLDDIYTKFKIDYNFDIPPAVIKTVLKKIEVLTLNNRIYAVNNFDFNTTIEIESIEVTIEQENEKLLQDLFSFVEKNRNTNLSEIEKEALVEAFKDYLLDNNTDVTLIDELSAFIIINNPNPEFNKTLQRIKEGVILFTGLQYNPTFNHNNWNDNITIYLNTEVLFHFGRFNDSIFYELFMDFFNLVKEANKKKKIISLKYFRETKDEIDRFFYAADLIIKQKKALNPTSEAMLKLVNSCDSASKLMDKKVDFYTLLQTTGIIEETEDIELDEKSYQYNIDSSELYNDLTIVGSKDDIEEYIELLNKISIKRAHKVKNNFARIGYILLTENRKIQQIAWNKKVKDEGSVPLATNLQFMTNKLWYKLYKGFGLENYPSSFKVITKAQIVLSSHVSEKLSAQYDELIKEVHSGTLTEEKALSILYEIKSNLKSPEELSEENISSVLHILAGEKLDEYITKHEKIKSKAEDVNEENSLLKIKLTNQKLEYERTKTKTLEENSTLKETIELKTKKFQNDILLEKKKRLKNLEKTKDRIGLKSRKRYDRYKLKLLLPLPMIYLVLIMSISYFGWNLVEPIVWVITLAIPFILNSIYIYYNEKDLNISHILNIKQEEIIKEESLLEEFEIKEIHIINNEIDDLSKELGE